jgi:hypothetical protein
MKLGKFRIGLAGPERPVAFAAGIVLSETAGA